MLENLDNLLIEKLFINRQIIHLSHWDNWGSSSRKLCILSKWMGDMLKVSNKSLRTLYPGSNKFIITSNFLSSVPFLLSPIFESKGTLLISLASWRGFWLDFVTDMNMNLITCLNMFSSDFARANVYMGLRNSCSRLVLVFKWLCIGF